MNCYFCALQLTVSEVEGDTNLAYATLVLDFAPPENAPLPTMADLRLEVSEEAQLLSVTPGAVIAEAEKQLSVDASTGESYFQPAPGVLQFVIMSSANSNTIGPGRWLELRFRLGGAFTPAQMPLVFVLQDREQTFAPPLADAALWGDTLDTPLSIWPWLHPDLVQ